MHVTILINFYYLVIQLTRFVRFIPRFEVDIKIQFELYFKYIIMIHAFSFVLMKKYMNIKKTVQFYSVNPYLDLEQLHRKANWTRCSVDMLSVTSIHGWKKETVYIISFFVLIITIILQTLCPLVIVFLNARVLMLLSRCLKILQRISDCHFKVIMYKWKFPTCIMDIHKKKSRVYFYYFISFACNFSFE